MLYNDLYIENKEEEEPEDPNDPKGGDPTIDH